MSDTTDSTRPEEAEVQPTVDESTDSGPVEAQNDHDTPSEGPGALPSQPPEEAAQAEPTAPATEAPSPQAEAREVSSAETSASPRSMTSSPLQSRTTARGAMSERE